MEIPSRWVDLTLSDMFFAYRKAKSDCFFEHTVGAARGFVEYEQDLPGNLASLLKKLSRGKIDEVLLQNLGTPRLAAKRLGITPKSNDPLPHSFFSDPDRAFENLETSYILQPEFRLIGDFPVEMHVLSALWINLVGHRFDAALSKHSYGSRLRRYRASNKADRSLGEYHLNAIGSFEPYFRRYGDWRADGLKAIRSELKIDRSVVVMSMDLTCYYHQIDPTFLTDEKFLRVADLELSSWEREFTSSFVAALKAWSSLAVQQLKSAGCASGRSQIGGIPIGLSISKIISNVLLLELDRDIVEGLAPIYYGRYVDDIFLVLRDPGKVRNGRELMQFIAGRTKSFPASQDNESNQTIRLHLAGGYLHRTLLELQPTKQKVFFLSGPSGLDLLDNIETQIRNVSSERRLMPSVDNLENMASAKVLTSAGNAVDEPDALRKADGLSVRRLGWAIQLRAVETLARDLHPGDWSDEREKFYKFAETHILRADKLLDHIDYLPRLVSLAVAVGDWVNAKALVDAANRAISKLEDVSHEAGIRVNGIQSSQVSGAPMKWNAWNHLRDTVQTLLQDATLRSIPWQTKTGKGEGENEEARSLLRTIGLGELVDVADLVLQFREADWATISYKDHLKLHARRERPRLDEEEILYDSYEHASDVSAFLTASSRRSQASSAVRLNPQIKRRLSQRSLLPYLFPNRAYTASEIAQFLPDLCIFSSSEKSPIKASRNWGRFVRAMRGVWIRPSLFEEGTGTPTEVDNEPPAKIALIGRTEENGNVRLGISSLATTDASWSAAAAGASDVSRARYKNIERIVNLALQTHPRPHYLLLPELSLPVRWLRTVTRLLQNANISLICGLDYHHAADKSIHSEAAIMLLDTRLGFRSFVELRQPKECAAPNEEHELLSRFGKSWTANLPPKPLYVHNGFCFGVLICSELQNVGHRLNFQGEVDSLMILSWNKDVETFASLIESASLDVHAYIALVNNRRYGDSRVRVPAKKSFNKDLCRLRGGLNDHLVVVEIDVESLRKFQSRSKRWPYPDDEFKPVPEGFSIAQRRRTTP